MSLDKDGVCNYCLSFENEGILNQKTHENLSQLITQISAVKSSAKYNCIAGISGGIDSCYMVVKAIEHGLKPILVHFDNGWNTPASTQNINKIVDKYELDLITHVVDWEEFKDIQISLLKASVLDIELATDHAFVSVLHKEAIKRRLKYVLTGHNLSSESMLPYSWYHCKRDYFNIKSIHKKFGKLKMRTYPYLNFWEMYRIEKFKKVINIHLLDYIDYDRHKAIQELTKVCDWTDYGGKHNESVFTRFYQGYVLPVKFGIDKREAHLSSAINSGLISRDEALKILTTPPYLPEQLAQDMDYVLKKLQISTTEFERLMSLPIKSHLDYPSLYNRHYKWCRMVGKKFGDDQFFA